MKPLMKKLGVSQTELSKMTDGRYSQRIISYFVNNEREMNEDATYTIARALGVHVEELHEWKQIDRPE